MLKLWYYPKGDTYHVVHETTAESGCIDVSGSAEHIAEAMFKGIEVPPICKFKPLPEGPYDVLLADPAWNYVTYSGSGAPARGDQPYDTVPLATLMRLPVQEITAPDCALVMWYLGSHLEQALTLGRMWGFDYKTDLLTWVKTGKTDPDVRPISMGHWSRKQVEQALLFTRGNPKRWDAGVRQLIEVEEHVIHAPKREHSRKPDEQYDRLGRLFGPKARKVELFARYKVEGWDGWGDEYPEDEYGGL